MHRDNLVVASLNLHACIHIIVHVIVHVIVHIIVHTIVHTQAHTIVYIIVIKIVHTIVHISTHTTYTSTTGFGLNLGLLRSLFKEKTMHRDNLVVASLNLHACTGII